MALDQDIYFPDAGGTVDMTSPNALLAPDNSQNLLAPDLSGARQAVAQGPTAMPVKTGWGGFTQNGIQHSNSTKRKIGAALLSMLSPEAGAAVTDQPFNAAMGQAQETEAERQKRIGEPVTLAEHAAKIAESQARATKDLGENTRAQAQADLANRRLQAPSSKAVKAFAQAVGMDDPDQLDFVDNMDDPSRIVYMNALQKQLEAGSKTADISGLADEYAKAIGHTDPNFVASLKKSFRTASSELVGKVFDALKPVKPEKDKPEPSLDKQDADLTAKEMAGTITPDEATQLKAIRAARTRVPAATFNMNNPQVDPVDVKYWADQTQQDAKNFGLIKNKTLQNAVTNELSSRGVNVNQLDSQTRDASKYAQAALTHIDKINQSIAALDAKGQLGPVMGRWNDFMTGTVGKGAEYNTLRDNIGLLQTAMGRVHGGARGGSSPAMLQHFKGMLSAKNMDRDTLTSGLNVFKDWLTTYANMGPAAGPSGSNPAATHKFNPATGKIEAINGQ